MNPANGRLLLVCTGPVAALVRAMPAVSDLQRHRPGLRLDWLVDESLAELPRLHPGVQRVIGVRPPRWRSWLADREARAALGHVRRQLQAETYDLVIDLDGRRAGLWWALQAGAPVVGFERAQCPEPSTALAYRRSTAVPGDWPPHERPRLLLAAQLGWPAPDTPAHFGLIPPAAPWRPPVLGAALLAGPAEDDPWPDAAWQALAERLKRARLSPLWLSTEPAGQARAQRLAAAAGGEAPAPLSLGPLVAVLAPMRLVVARGADPAWLAAAVGRRTLALLPEADQPRPSGPRALLVAAGPQAQTPAAGLAALEQLLAA